MALASPSELIFGHGARLRRPDRGRSWSRIPQRFRASWGPRDALGSMAGNWRQFLPCGGDLSRSPLLRPRNPPGNSRRDLCFNLSPYGELSYPIRAFQEPSRESLAGLSKKHRSPRQMGLHPGINPAPCLRLNLDFGVGAGFLDAPPRYAPMVDAISESGFGAAPGFGNPLLTLSLAHEARHDPRVLDPPNLFSLWSLCLE